MGTMTKPIQTARNDDSARVVQHLHLNLNQDDREPEVPVQRPALNVPVDLGYSTQRFVNEDRVLQPLRHFANSAPLTEAQSRARMATILAAATNALAPTRN